MVGVVIVAHGQLARELLNITSTIAGPLERVEAVVFDPQEDPSLLREKLHEAVRKVKGDKGVLLLTDTLGGSPSNLGLSFLSEGEIEVLTGVNLPMLLKLASGTRSKPLREVARELQDYGKEAICLASELLTKKACP
jgi:PTS system mannose-specific IIA component